MIGDRLHSLLLFLVVVAAALVEAAPAPSEATNRLRRDEQELLDLTAQGMYAVMCVCLGEGVREGVCEGVCEGEGVCMWLYVWVAA